MSSAGRKDQPTGGKSRGYASLSLGPSYGSSQNESRTGNRKGTMQTLGKIAPTRRMPGPAQVRSLRSENEGNDPTVNLVPQGGGGWKSSADEEEKKEKAPHTREAEKPRRPPRAPEHFTSDFPSLEEQEKMTKREWEELERRKRDESHRLHQERGGSQSPSNDWPQYPKYPEPPVWDHQPPPNYPPPPGHVHGYPPPTGSGRGYPPPPNHPHSHHPTPHHPPFFVPPPRQGMPLDYPPYPGSHSHNRGYLPHPGFGHHAPYPHGYHPNPYEMNDPYHLSPRDRRGSGRSRSSRPPTVKDHDLQNMDADDDDEGWAGHHEEVDYTKEVVFEDSSDEESNGDKRDQLAVGGYQKHSEQSGKENKPPSSEHKRQDNIPPDHWKNSPVDNGSGENRLIARGHRNSPPRSGSPVLSSGMPIYQQGPPPHYPPHPVGHHDMYPHLQQTPHLQHGSPYPHHPSGHPLRGGAFGPSPSKLRRVGGERDGDHRGRHNFNPHWEHDSDHRHKRRLSSTQDEPTSESNHHPRVMRHSREDRMSQSGQSDQPAPGKGAPGVEERSRASPHDQHGTVAGERDLSSPGGQHPIAPQPRSQPRKIMIRNLSEQVSSEDQLQGRAHSGLQAPDAHSGGQRDRGGAGHVGKGANQAPPSKPKMAWATTNEPFRVATSPPPPPPPPQSTTPTDEQLQQQKVTWNIDERGPISTPKTLYEPEGRTSQEKFKKYHRSVSGGETGNSASTASRGRISSTGSDKGGRSDGFEDGPPQGDGERMFATSRGEPRDENPDREQPSERTRPPHSHFDRQQPHPPREGTRHRSDRSSPAQPRDVGRRRNDHSPPMLSRKQVQHPEDEPFADDQRSSGRRDGRRPRSRGQEERREREDAWKQDRRGRGDQRRDDLRRDEPRRSNRDRRRGSRDEPVDSRRAPPHKNRGGEGDGSRSEHESSSRGKPQEHNFPPRGKDGEVDILPRATGNHHDPPTKARGEHGGSSKGKREHNAAPAKGRGEQDGAPRGRAEQDGPLRGRGDHNGPQRGKGDYDASSRGKREHDPPSRGRDHDTSSRSRIEHSTSSRAREHDGPARGREEQQHSISKAYGDHEGPPKGRGKHETTPREPEEPNRLDPKSRQQEQMKKGGFAGRTRDEPISHEPWKGEKGERKNNQHHHTKPGDSSKKENQQRVDHEQTPENYSDRKNDEQWPPEGGNRHGEVADLRRGRKGRGGGPRNRSNAQQQQQQHMPPVGRSGAGLNHPEAPPCSPQSADFDKRGSDERRNYKGPVGPSGEGRGKRKLRGEEGRQLRQFEHDHETAPDRLDSIPSRGEAERNQRKDPNPSSPSGPVDPAENEQDFGGWDRPPSRSSGHRGAGRNRSRGSRRSEPERGRGKPANQPPPTTARRAADDREPPLAVRGRGGERPGNARQGPRPTGGGPRQQRARNDQPPASHQREEAAPRSAVWAPDEPGRNSVELAPGKAPTGGRPRGGGNTATPRGRADPNPPSTGLQGIYENLDNVSSSSDWEDDEQFVHRQPQHRETPVRESRRRGNEDDADLQVGHQSPLDNRPPRRGGGRLGGRGSGSTGRGRAHQGGDRRTGPAVGGRPAPQGQIEGAGARVDPLAGRGGRRGDQGAAAAAAAADSGRPGSGTPFNSGSSSNRQPHHAPLTQDARRQQDEVGTSSAGSRKGQDIANYDLNSHNVYVVDRQDESRREGERATLSPVVSSDSDGFTVVVSKKERKENNREEKRKHEVEKGRRHDDDPHRQRAAAQSARSLPGRGGDINSNSKTTQPSQPGWGTAAGEFPATKNMESIWSQSEKESSAWLPSQSEPLSLASFGAVGDKPSKEQPLPPGIPPFSSSLISGGAYNMWSISSDLFATQGVAPRKGGGMLQAAIDSSILATATMPPGNQGNSAPLTQILMEPSQNLPEKSSRVVQLEESTAAGRRDGLPLPPPQQQQQQAQQHRDPRAAGSVGAPKQARIEPEGRALGRGGMAKGGEQQDRFYTPPHARQDDVRSSRITTLKGPPTSAGRVTSRPSSAGGRAQKVYPEPKRGDQPPSARGKIPASGCGSSNSQQQQQQQQQPPRPERAGSSSTQRGHHGAAAVATRACGTESGCGEEDSESDVAAEDCAPSMAAVMHKTKALEKNDGEYVDPLPLADSVDGGDMTGAQLPSLPNRPANGEHHHHHHHHHYQQQSLQPPPGHKPAATATKPSPTSSNLCTKFGSVTYASALRATIVHDPPSGVASSSAPVAQQAQQQSGRNSVISRTSSRVSTPSMGPETAHNNSVPAPNIPPSPAAFEKTPPNESPRSKKEERPPSSNEFPQRRVSSSSEAARPHQDERAVQSPSHLLSRVGGGGTGRQGSPHLVNHFSQSPAPHSPARTQQQQTQATSDVSFGSPSRPLRPVGAHAASSRSHVALPAEDHWPILSQEEVGKPLALAAAAVVDDRLGLRPSSAQDRILDSLQQPCYPPNSPFSHSLPDSALDFKNSPLSSDSAVYSSYTPLTRTSSVPSKLPLSSPVEGQEEVIQLSPSPSVDAEEQEQAAAGADNPVQSNKSSLNITASVFVPGKKPFAAKSAAQSLQRQANASDGSGARNKRPSSSKVAVSSSAPQLAGQQQPPLVQQQQQQQQQPTPPLISQPPFPIHLLQANPFQLAAILAAAAAEQRKNSAASQSLPPFQPQSVPVSIPLPQGMSSVVHTAQPPAPAAAAAHSTLHMSSFMAQPAVHSQQLSQAHLGQQPAAAVPGYVVKPRQLLAGGYEPMRHAVPPSAAAVQYIEKEKLVRAIKTNQPPPPPPMPSTPMVFPPLPPPAPQQRAMVQPKPLPLQSPMRPQGAAAAISRIPTALSVLATPTGLRSSFAHMQQPALAAMPNPVATPTRTLLAPSMTQAVVVPGNMQQLPVQQPHSSLIQTAPPPAPQQQSSQSAPALDNRRVARPPLLPTPPGFGYITPSQTTPARTVSTPTTVLHPSTWPVTGTPGLHLQASPLPSVLAEQQHTASVSAIARTTYPITGSL